MQTKTADFDRSHRGTWTRTYRQVLTRHKSLPALRPAPYPHQRKRLQEQADRCGKPLCTGRHVDGACVKKGRPGRTRGHTLWGRGQQTTFHVLAALQLGALDGWLGIHLGDHKLAAEANCARSTVHAHLRDLCTLGLVELRTQGGGYLPHAPGGKANVWALTQLGWAIKRNDAQLVPWMLRTVPPPMGSVLEGAACDVGALSVVPLSENNTATETQGFQTTSDDNETRPAPIVGDSHHPRAPSANGILATSQPRRASAISKTVPSTSSPWSKKLEGFTTDEIATHALVLGYSVVAHE